MEEICKPGIAIEFLPRRAQWSKTVRDEIAKSCNNAACLRGLEYRPGRFDWTDKKGIFKVDKGPSSVEYAHKVECISLLPEDVTLRMCVEMLKALQGSGHTILATRGFKKCGGDLVIGPSVRETVASFMQCVYLPKRIEDDYEDVDCWCE
jgi:hypothetical protein